MVRDRRREDPDGLCGDVLSGARARGAELAALRGELAAAGDDRADSGAAAPAITQERRLLHTPARPDGTRRVIDPATLVDMAVVAGLIAVAAREAHRVTAGLHLPPDPDLYRSAAISQTLLNGSWLGDPFFAGEWNWYNPLVPAIVAVLHVLTGTPVLELYARGGVLLNMLAPVALWALVRALFGSGAGVAAVFAFLFLPPRFLPGWSTAGYWPWLFSSVFTQAVFYAGLLAVDRAGHSTRIRDWLAAGIALGVVFLGHTAPALIFGGVVVLAAVRVWRRGESARRAMLLLASTLALAMVVSLPLVLSVVAR